MNDVARQSIKVFFNALDLLRKTGVVRSDVVFGDIGEYLCAVVFPGLTLVKEKTNRGYDAELNGKRVQIKFSNSADTKNIDLGDVAGYDELIVVLGSNSVHRMQGDSSADYLFYRYTSKEVTERFSVNSGYKLSRTKHFKTADAEYFINTA